MPFHDSTPPDNAPSEKPHHTHESAGLFEVVDLTAHFAELLSASRPPFSIETIIMIPELLISDSLEIPECFRQIPAPLRRMTFTFKKEYPREVANAFSEGALPVLNFGIHAEFYDGDSASEMHRWLAHLVADPNTLSDTLPVYNGHASQINEIDSPDTEYDIRASDREISDLIQSLQRFMPRGGEQNDGIINPTAPFESLSIESILTTSLHANKISTKKYSIEYDGLGYEVKVQWFDDIPEAVEIKRLNGGNIKIVNGEPIYQVDDEVYEISMTARDASARITIESERSSRDDNSMSERDQIAAIKELLSQLIERVPVIDIAHADLVTLEQDGDAKPTGARDAADIKEARAALEEIYPESE